MSLSVLMVLLAGLVSWYLAGTPLWHTSIDPLLTLNATLNGRLQEAQPLASVCYSQADGDDCIALKKALTSGHPGLARTNKYPGFQHIQGEGCAADPDDQCLLEQVTLAVPHNVTCRQGVVSSHYVAISSSRDVQAAFDYARNVGATLSIKNSGLDYVSRSSRSGSLALWTRGLREMAHHPSFIPDGSPNGTAPVNAVTFGAGVSVDEAYAFAHEEGITFSAASIGNIGISGGWLLNGGHGVLAGGLGLGVDRVLQFTIVTPDGKVRTVNKWRDSSLFWALRGGGGGVFGVVLNSTHLVDIEQPITVATLMLPTTADSQLEFTNILFQKMPKWALDGWGGPASTNFVFFANPYLSTTQAEVSLAPLIEFVRREGGSSVIQSYNSFFDYYTEIINGSLAAPEAISYATFLTSKVIPEDNFHNDSIRSRMVDQMMKTTAAGLPTFLLATTPLRYGRTIKQQNTSLHPAWYKSPGILITSTGWGSGSSFQERKKTALVLSDVTNEWNDIVLDGCSYANEADPWLENWAQQFWGDNYEKLLAIKHNVDPDNLLSCWHCVGWNDSLPNYECMSRLAP